MQCKKWQRRNSAHAAFSKIDVELLFATDEPVDMREYLQILRNDSASKAKMLSAYFADRVFAIESKHIFQGYLEKLGESADVHIASHQTWFAQF